jgi:hypothetical protein
MRLPAFRSHLSPLCGLAALLCLFCADDKLAGGFDDVENPALTVSLRDTLGHAYGAGEISLYARYQNPGKDSVPLIARAVPAGASVTLTDSVVLQAMAEAKLRGTPWPDHDIVGFNLVAKAAGGEAFLDRFILIKRLDGRFAFRRLLQDGTQEPDPKGILRVSPAMAAPATGFRGQVGARGLQLGLKAVFIGGSPYRAGIESDGSFALARLASGRYEVLAESGDGKVYAATDSLDTGAAYAPTDWSEAELIWVE